MVTILCKGLVQITG